MQTICRTPALEWLINNKVITREQRNDAVVILQSISDWLERLGNERAKASRQGPVTRYTQINILSYVTPLHASHRLARLLVLLRL
jgi:hypothetical protein